MAEVLHPDQFYDWYGGSDEAVEHLQAFTKSQNDTAARMQPIPDWRIAARGRDEA
jgi:hypothetical protein